MKEKKTHTNPGLLLLLLALVVAPLIGPLSVQAQEIPRQGAPPVGQIRGYVPPDQLVSFRPETPFTQFIDFVNPIFQRVNGKEVIDPETRQFPIGISISGLHYFDALSLVLQYNNLAFRETERFFIVEEAPPEINAVVEGPGAALAETALVPATLESREIKISAVLFSINKTKAQEIGTDWNVFFGGETVAGGGGQNAGGLGGAAGGGQGGAGQAGGQAGSLNTIPKFFLDTSALADAVSDWLIMPDAIDVATLTQLFRLLEDSGVGETIANPSITVQSGQDGRIQIGQDLPFRVRDFSGNTITQFVSTGIIINVTPTLITEAVIDTTGAPTLDFIHLNINVENSNGQISNAGPIVDRSTATTQVILLDGEPTIIGGLYSTEEVEQRRGIPVLKDLPWWFFGIPFLTSVKTKQTVNRELVVLLHAELIDSLTDRSGRPFDNNLLDKKRREVLRRMQELDDGAPDKVTFDQVFENK